MIAKLERTLSTSLQTGTKHKTSTTNGSNKIQCINKCCYNTFARTEAKAHGGLRVVFKKMKQKCDIVGQNSKYEYTNETYAFFLWKHCIFRIQLVFISHVSHFSEKMN